MPKDEAITSVFGEDISRTVASESIKPAETHKYNIHHAYRLLPTECSCGCRQVCKFTTMWELRRCYSGYGCVTEKDYFSVVQFPTRDVLEQWLANHKW